VSSLKHPETDSADYPLGLQRSFREKGYACVKGLFDAEELQELERELNRYIKKVVPDLPPQEAFYEIKDNPESLKQMHRIIDYDPWFREFFLQERFLGLSEHLLGTPVIPKGVEYFAKPPRVGNATPPHQDGYYFMLEPNEALTLWVALDEIDEGNGCIRYVEGSHLKGMRPHAKSNVLGFSQGITDYGPDDAQWERPMNCQPGDLIAHHSMMIHRADANHSDRPRRAMALVCYSSLAHEDSAKLAAYQQELTQELLATDKI
jgi:phytanoyl-CoA hydroxylase